MKMPKILCIFIGLVSLVSVVAYGATIRVPDDYATIQEAIDAATSGDIILADPGVYVGGIDFGGKNLLIQSTKGPGVTTIDGNGDTGVLIGPQGALIGFSITNSIAYFGAGIEVIGAGTIIRNNIFDGNIQQAGGFGAAIGGNSASPTIEQNVFRKNTCDNQYLSGVISFVNDSSPRIINNIIENNPCRGINMTLPVGNQPEIINNTIVNNRTGVRVDRRINTSLQIYCNNIIVGNEIGLEIEFGTEAGNPTWENNLVFDNNIDYDGISDQTGLNGNISEDPLFVDPANGDYHLTANSPCIDAGTNDTADLPDIDFEGGPRILDGDNDGTATVDIGADEAFISITGENLGIGIQSGGKMTNCLCVDPASITDDTNRPEDLIYGLIEMEIAGSPGVTSIVVSLPNPAPEGYKWYKYSSTEGWIDFSRKVISGGIGDGAEFNDDRTQVIIYITDNGHYDDDPAVGLIKDPSGLGYSPAPATSDGDGGGG